MSQQRWCSMLNATSKVMMAADSLVLGPTEISDIMLVYSRLGEACFSAAPALTVWSYLCQSCSVFRVLSVCYCL